MWVPDALSSLKESESFLTKCQPLCWGLTSETYLMISSSFSAETRREGWLRAFTLTATYFSCDQRQLQTKSTSDLEPRKGFQFQSTAAGVSTTAHRSTTRILSAQQVAQVLRRITTQLDSHPGQVNESLHDTSLSDSEASPF